MPVYNGQRYLDQSIESIVAQDEALELVIVDDGSTDETPALLARWAARDPRIVVLRHEENGGAARALNAGLAMARGEYIARHDADDVSLRNRLAHQVAALDGNPDAVLTTVARCWIDAHGKRFGSAPSNVQPPDVVRFLLQFTPQAIGLPGQSMFRAAAARAVGGWNDSFRVAQGWEFAARLATQGKFVTLPEVGMCYRVHDERASIRHAVEQRDNATRITQTLLSVALGRPVALEEAGASASVWFLPPRSGAAPVAERLLREASERFELSASDRARVRRIAAKRFVRAAALHARRGRIGDALQHFAAAVRV